MYTGTLRLSLPERSDVAIERSMEYFVLSIGCIARRAFFTTFGLTARFTARPGCTARRTLRGTRSLVKNPIANHPPIVSAQMPGSIPDRQEFPHRRSIAPRMELRTNAFHVYRGSSRGWLGRASQRWWRLSS